MNRYQRTEKSKDIAERMCSVGSLVPFNQNDEKLFFLQGANIVTVPKKKGGIHLDVLFGIVFIESVFTLDELCENYDRQVKALGKESVEITEDVKDTIMGSLIMSQAAVPVSSLAYHISTWQSRSIVPTKGFSRSNNVYAQRLFMSASANPSGSIYDHYNSLIEPSMTKEQTTSLQNECEKALEELINLRDVRVNVPASMFNQ